MGMKAYASVDQYLCDVKSPDRELLEHIRKLVLSSIPEVKESISYGMPAYKYRGKPLIYYGAFKDHLSLFPTGSNLGEIENKLSGFRAAKGTIHFSSANPLTDELIIEILSKRAEQIDANQA